MCEKWMHSAFPGSDLKADPHINSKIHVWKRHYGVLYFILGITGTSLNESHEVEANDDIWQQAIKLDECAKGMQKKNFPFYSDWCAIFGKDRATGESAEVFADVVQDLMNNNGSDFSGQNNLFNSIESAYVSQDEGSSMSKGSSKGKKRKMGDGLDELFISTMSSFCENTNSRMGEIAERMGDLAKRMGTAYDASKKREMVFDTLGRMPFLDLHSRVHVAQILCNNSNELDLFFSMPDEGKAVMVQSIISMGGCGSV